MRRDWFHAVADRVTEPLLLLSPAGIVRASNVAARSAIEDLDGSDLVARAADPASFAHYLELAGRSGSPLPGVLRFPDDVRRWRCDASVTIIGGVMGVVMHLREARDAARRFVALNEQIERMHAEIRRREVLERERERLLASEREARALAEETSRFKDELLGAVSHELRTPLHAIQGWLALIRRNPADLQQLARGLDVIERNVAVEVQLTEDLVDASMAITGRMRLELQSVDLELIVRQAIEGARPAAEAKGLRVEVVADVGQCVVNGDPARLLQVLWNLLSNATRHTPRGGRIQVVLRRLESHAEICVSDNGEGIAADLLPYVFDRFRRADGSPTRRSGGLGLGLSIVRHLVELHGGFVIVDSDGPGRGARFTVNLPLPIFEHRMAVRRSGPAPGGSSMLAGVTVLLVEDHDDSRELLAALLAGEGAEVRAVEGAARARETFRDQPPDIVISDIEMPDEDGFTLMRKLRDIEAELRRDPVPAVAVSAHAIGDARLPALRAGYHTFLSKPIVADELIAMIANLCFRRVRSPGG